MPSLRSLWLVAMAVAALANPLDLNQRRAGGDGGKRACRPNGEECGPIVCPLGLQCCNESCGYCTKPGEPCTTEACLGPVCGPTVCASGEECCNESCGYCTKPGESCTEELCNIED